MTVDLRFVIRKLQNLEEMYAVYSAVTRMPFATCDEETFNDQVWVFSNKDDVQTFSKTYTEKKILLMGVKIKKEEAPLFYMNLFAMGINEVVFQEGDVRNKIPLEKIVQIPDYSKLPENQRPIWNPQLQLTAIYFLQELRKPGVAPDRNELKELEEEMSVNLVKARFLMPVEVDEKDGKQENIRMIYVQNKEGDRFQPIFSDTNEIMKHFRNKQTRHKVLQIPFDQLIKYMIKDVKGFVVNPEGINLILSQKQIQQLTAFFKPET